MMALAKKNTRWYIIMKFFQWGKTMAKSAEQSIFAAFKTLFKRDTSRSSLVRENHELRYKVELLKDQNSKLLTKLEAVKDENVLLWQHMEEMKESERAIMKTLTEEIEAQMIKSLMPVGDA